MNINVVAMQALVDRECYYLQQKVELIKEGKVAIFPAGPTAQAFFYTLRNQYKIETDLFIDNNPTLDGKIVCGKEIKHSPWGEINEYSVLIPTSAKYFHEISVQLKEFGRTMFMSASAFVACQYAEKYSNIVNMLEDDLSKISYLASIYNLLTFDNSFVHYVPNQYFGLPNFSLNNSEIIVDAGAYVGDTVEEYVRRGTEGVNVYAFEPYDKALDKLRNRVSRVKQEWLLKDDDIVIVPAGVGAETKKIFFSHIGNPTMIIQSEQGAFELPVYSLDDYFRDKEPFTILKADVEGSELDMLKGAKNTIRKSKPKMALSIYHNPDDFVSIIEYVKSLVPEYHLSVRNHSPDYKDTILYCWC